MVMLECHLVGQSPCQTPFDKSLHNLIILLLDEGGEGFSPVLLAVPFYARTGDSLRFHPIFSSFCPWLRQAEPANSPPIDKGIMGIYTPE